MGLALLLLLVLLTAAGLWWFGKLRGAAFQLALAALMIGSAGYALQGRPELAGAPKAAGQRAAPLPLTKPRQAMFGQFNAADRWLIIADGYESRGETADAVGIIRAGLRAHPNDPALWVGMGNALVDHAGMLTPAATIAFERARAAAPNHPAPLFFQGLALARSGQNEQALALWQQALKLTPPTTSYRPFIAEGIAALGAAPPATGR
ncbi:MULTISPECIES: tetratricopeptide repeat protein [Sphingomonas]|uniref:tetratricopeptide repeat protein n=1 Tax=Sphingomonas TaxID=13687 RepID=UPI001269AC28|nr:MULTISPECIES: tetratricopeptide repeat protein [Sphingomonas]